ncbi:uncharacterized protein [Coffea arabica]|uniref:AWS domain-containing protein n=1 Tax=Coffea arabica TaxID=13443 RepID=A0ABM4X7C7_COFAR
MVFTQKPASHNEMGVSNFDWLKLWSAFSTEKQNLKELSREIYRAPPSNISTRSRRHRKKVELPKGPSSFTHIYHNDFVGRKPKKLKDDDVAICVYKYDNPESACGEGCLNVMTSTECIHGHWPCQDYCKNQDLKTKRTIGGGHEYNGLYFLNPNGSIACPTTVFSLEIHCRWVIHFYKF